MPASVQTSQESCVAQRQRREFMSQGLLAGGAWMVAGSSGAAEVAGGLPVMPELSAALHPRPDDWGFADIARLHDAFRQGTLTVEALCRHYLHRIEWLDRQGPNLHSVLELNPHALEHARERDQRMAAMRQQPASEWPPLWGVPVLLKDNIATADAMSTTAGSLALDTIRAKADAELVRSLRDGGAIILGKANLSEWANFRSTHSVSGWSSKGGQTRNPHALSRSPSGSSSGSAAAVAAGLCAVAVGTETDGSITSPASACGVVGFKPTVGAVSREGVVPISASQDTAGPMARTVADCARLMEVLVTRDAADEPTMRQPEAWRRLRWRDMLSADALKGVRLAVMRAELPDHAGVRALFESQLQRLSDAGAVVLEGVELPPASTYADAEFTVLLHEFKAQLPEYLKRYAPHAVFSDLAGLMAWNERHADRAMPLFAQELFQQAQATAGLDSPEYRQARALILNVVRRQGLDRLAKQHKLDGWVGVTGHLPWLVDPVLGDQVPPGGCTTPYAVAGYPHLSVPMGLVAGLPVGLSLASTAWRDPEVLAWGHAYELLRGPAVRPSYKA